MAESSHQRIDEMERQIAQAIAFQTSLLRALRKIRAELTRVIVVAEAGSTGTRDARARDVPLPELVNAAAAAAAFFSDEESRLSLSSGSGCPPTELPVPSPSRSRSPRR